MTICSDLWWDIVSYIPHNDLRDFSAAHATFQKMICETGIRMFYDTNEVAIDICQKDVTVIKLSSGKKYVLKDGDNHFIDLVSGQKIIKDKITWTIKPVKTEVWMNDPINKVAMIYGHASTTFTSSWLIHDCKNVENALHMNRGISGKIDYIDMTTNYAMYFDEENEVTIELEEFDIIYQNNEWTANN